MKIPRILLCAPASGSGKTLITCGLLQMLKNKGITVGSFKCGPDYIDPMFHTKVIGTRAVNLDTFFTTPDVTRYLLCANAEDVDLAVMEGVMGYYDGLGGTSVRASTYELACVTDTPSILIVNCKGMSVSILPLIRGFMEFRSDSHIKGVILNQMSGMLYPRVKDMIQNELGIAVAGYLPKMDDCMLESRHLGLIMPDEIEDFKDRLERLAAVMEETIDLDTILKIAEHAPDLDNKKTWKEESSYNFQLPEKVRIGIAKDEAFCFIYEDNIRMLKQMGAEPVFFSPLKDQKLPDGICGMIFYGGYPELLAEKLEENVSFREAVREAYHKGMPVMAECGGFMYLHDTIYTPENKGYQGVGIIKGCTYKTDSLKRFGYVNIQSRTGTAFESPVKESPAHEFHYYESESCGSDFQACKPVGKRNWECIHGNDHLMAGFPHFYYYGNPDIPKAFLERCLKDKKQKRKDKDK